MTKMVKFERKVFFDKVRHAPFKGLTQRQVDGLNRLLATWEKEHHDQPLEYLAYCLATSFWETGRKMWPVEEIGKGRGRRYGVRVGPFMLIYYGRGDVQLTWERNYKFAGGKIGVNLHKYPHKALEPGPSAMVLFRGSLEGWFTGKKLSDYRSHLNRRRVINGTDRAAKIAAFAKMFETALRASRKEVTKTEEGVDMWKMLFSKLFGRMSGGGLTTMLASAVAAFLGVDVATGSEDILTNIKNLNWAEIAAGLMALLRGAEGAVKIVAEPEVKGDVPGEIDGGGLVLTNADDLLAKVIEKAAKREVDFQSAEGLAAAMASIMAPKDRDANEIFELGVDTALFVTGQEFKPAKKARSAKA